MNINMLLRSKERNKNIFINIMVPIFDNKAEAETWYVHGYMFSFQKGNRVHGYK